MQLNVLQPPQKSCERCALSRHHPEPFPGARANRSVGIPFRRLPKSREPSPSTPAVVVVGPSPSYNEDILGESWVYLANESPGWILEDVIVDEVGTKPHNLPALASVYAGNLVRCRTGFQDPPPNKKSIEACSHWLYRDLASIADAHRDAPLYLMVVGSTTISHLLGPGGIRGQSRTNGHRTIRLVNRDWHAFASYNPAALTTNPNYVHSVEDHWSVLYDHLTGRLPQAADPLFSRLRPPRPSDTRTASVDIETYGFFDRSLRTGETLPFQSTFHPHRCVVQDGCPKADLLTTASITLVDGDPDLALDPITRWAPGRTFFFRLDIHRHVQLFTRWLRHLRVCVGSNLPFDISMLRYCDYPAEHLTLIDTVGLSYLESEVRVNRGQKELAPILGTSGYDEEEQARLDLLKREGIKPFKTARDPRARLYNGRDTHNAIENAAALARRIRDRYPDTEKLSPLCIEHYSETVHLCVDLSLAGTAVSERRLLRLERTLRSEIDLCERLARDNHGLLLSKNAAGGKPGCQRSQSEFIDRCIEDADRTLARGLTIMDHPLAEYTEKKGSFSLGEQNRNLLLVHLPHDSPVRPGLDLWRRHTKASKMLSSFIYPVRYHLRNKIANEKCRLIPFSLASPYQKPLSPEQAAKEKRNPPRSPRLAYHPRTSLGVFSTYFPFPMSYEGGDEGGTQQVRITCKNPAKPTWPKPIKECIVSRYPDSRPLWIDLSQIELRTAAVLSGEPSMLEAYRERRDLHGGRVFELLTPDELIEKIGEAPPQMPDALASRLGDREAIAVWRTLGGFDLWRQSGKTVNFADLFRAAAIVMQVTFLRDNGLIVPIEIFQRAVDGRPHLRPVLYEWQERLIHEAVQKGYTELPFFGQSRSYPGSADHIRGKMESTVVNFPVQASAANVTLSIQFQLRRRIAEDRRLRKVALQTDNIYDAIGFDCPNHLVPRLRSLVRAAIHHVAFEGYWARLCDHTSHHCPLEYESTFGVEDVAT